MLRLEHHNMLQRKMRQEDPEHLGTSTVKRIKQAIDAGDSDAVPVGVDADLDGNPRLLDVPETPDTGVGGPPVVDMGAYESQGVACGDADFDGDNFVNFTDLNDLLIAWGPCVACPEDINNDGMVGFMDLTLLLSAWGPCP